MFSSASSDGTDLDDSPSAPTGQGLIMSKLQMDVWCEVIPPFNLMPREMLQVRCCEGGFNWVRVSRGSRGRKMGARVGRLMPMREFAWRDLHDCLCQGLHHPSLLKFWPKW